MPPQTKRTGIHRNIKPKVFLVHGRADATKDSVARFLERLGVEAVILHEKANKGFTILEKLSNYSSVDFAVVLLTGDDQGGLAGKPFSTQKKRARQNVILELGYFLGTLGRSKVCSLYEDSVELPSDYHGIVYISLKDQWKTALANELQAAGLKIDLNQLLSI